MGELIQIAAIQKSRVLRLWERERIYNVPLVMLNRVIRDYGNLIVAIQEIKFNLGLDEYRRTMPTVTPSDASVRLTDGTRTQQKVLQAVTEMEEIFERRGV